MRREFKEVHLIFSLLFASLHSQYAVYGHQAGLLGVQREEKEEIIMAFSQFRKVSAVIHPFSIACSKRTTKCVVWRDSCPFINRIVVAGFVQKLTRVFGR